MMARHALGKAALGMCAAILLFGLSACWGDAFPDYNYKMTIYANGKAFSSVRRIEQEGIATIQSSSGRSVKRTLEGEAVIIELDGRVYYALLSQPDNPEYSLLTVTSASLGRAIPPNKPKSEVEAAIEEWLQDRQGSNPNASLDELAERSRAMTEVKGPHPLPRTLPSFYMDKGKRIESQTQTWPAFVTFDDPEDPKTVRKVNPDSIGVSQITVEITDEDVSKGIADRFAWWQDYRELRFDGKPAFIQDMTNSDFRHAITTGDFSTGVGN